jgi:hypothetical protein
MNLPYDPRTEQAIAIAPLYSEDIAHGPGHIRPCNNCKRLIWAGKLTIEFMAKHEVPAICPECAEAFAKGEI